MGLLLGPRVGAIASIVPAEAGRRVRLWAIRWDSVRGENGCSLLLASGTTGKDRDRPSRVPSGGPRAIAEDEEVTTEWVRFQARFWTRANSPSNPSLIAPFGQYHNLTAEERVSTTDLPTPRRGSGRSRGRIRVPGGERHRRGDGPRRAWGRGGERGRSGRQRAARRCG